MSAKSKILTAFVLSSACIATAFAQQQMVKITKNPTEKKYDITIDGKPFTSFLYPDSLEKPVLYPIRATNGTVVTRGFPLNPKPDDATDHPHHIGLWFNYENTNGLDFWNNSYAIPPDKKKNYGWVKTDKIIETADGETGKLTYHANWVNQANEVLLEETTTFLFSGIGHKWTIDRITTLKANIDVHFNDAKDGLLGFRAAHELQIPTDKDQKFTDDKGIVTIVKGGTDKKANGTYLTSEGKMGDSAWSTRGTWCKLYGKMGNDSISVVIIDHPKNPNYPTFWHARGYGLFAANPLGEKVFTNGASSKNFMLKKGESTTFRYRIVIDNGKNSMAVDNINKYAKAFAGVK